MIRIVSDSSTLYSIEEGKEIGVEILPLSVTIDNDTYKENEEITTEKFIDIINKGHLPITSQPAIGDVINIYEKYPDDEIINITMADGLSGTYSTACSAKAIVENPDRIEVINSKTLCGPEKYLVDTAINLANDGKSKEEIVSTINLMMKQTKSFLIPNDFQYLIRGGRVSSLVGNIGEKLKLVPVMTLADDAKKLVKFSTQRTFKKAIDKICASLIEEGVDSSYKIYISHGCAEDLAMDAKNIIYKRIPEADIEINILGPVFVAQGGPRAVSIQAIKKLNI